jgi:hypothetical protein
MSRFARRLVRLVLSLTALTAVWACNAPFIPVPPPGGISFSSALVSDGAGGQKTMWTTQGGANPQAAAALFYIYDSDQQAGVITHAGPDGSFVSTPMDGTKNDHIHIYFKANSGDYSPETCRLLVDGVPDAPLCP